MNWNQATDGALCLEAVRLGVADKVKMHTSSMDDSPLPITVSDWIHDQLTFGCGSVVFALGRHRGNLSRKTRRELVDLIEELWK